MTEIKGKSMRADPGKMNDLFCELVQFFTIFIRITGTKNGLRKTEKAETEITFQFKAAGRGPINIAGFGCKIKASANSRNIRRRKGEKFISRDRLSRQINIVGKVNNGDMIGIVTVKDLRLNRAGIIGKAMFKCSGKFPYLFRSDIGVPKDQLICTLIKFCHKIIKVQLADFFLNRQAQLVIARYLRVTLAESADLRATERGAGGFGHTGR